MKRLSIITSCEGHMNRTLSHRAVSQIAGFLLAFAIAGLSGCIPEKNGTCAYQDDGHFALSSEVECLGICSDFDKTACRFTPPQTAITGP